MKKFLAKLWKGMQCLLLGALAGTVSYIICTIAYFLVTEGIESELILGPFVMGIAVFCYITFISFTAGAIVFLPLWFMVNESSGFWKTRVCLPSGFAVGIVLLHVMFRISWGDAEGLAPMPLLYIMAGISAGTCFYWAGRINSRSK